MELYHQKKNFDVILNQINAIKKGEKKIHLEASTTIGNGIIQYKKEDLENFKSEFEKNSINLKLEKFVPASGAATRMFKFLSDFILEFKLEGETINGYINRSGNHALETFILAMEKLPFFNEVDTFLKQNFADFDKFSRDEKNFWFIETILKNKEFKFINKPKSRIAFP